MYWIVWGLCWYFFGVFVVTLLDYLDTKLTIGIEFELKLGDRILLGGVREYGWVEHIFWPFLIFIFILHHSSERSYNMVCILRNLYLVFVSFLNNIGK